MITDFRGIKARQILAILALHPGQPLAKTRLAKLLWDDQPPDSWHSTLEGYVSLLRQSLEPGVSPSRSMITTRRGSYCLQPDRIVSDLAEFDTLVGKAATLAPSAALPLLQAALALARGEVLADERWTWVAEIRGRYQRKVVEAHVRAGQHALAQRDIDTAARHGEHACDLDPLSEEAWTLLIASHWTAGRRSDGLRCFATLRSMLASELGIAPGRRAQQLHLMIIRDEPADSHARGSILDGPLLSGAR
ncbi:MAG TPA: BTAD domain-containing putative transcriptional regulator [Pseudonocardiaceae bacterium]|nr:BTAD domain-containing putative transcriptional regulator [Pseudonocardiaceae bacterium]